MPERIPGITDKSEYYTNTPSEMARQFLFYPLGAGIFYTDGSHRLSKWPDTGVLILRLDSGSGTLTTRFKTYKVEAKDVVIVDLAKPYEFHGACRMSWLRINSIGAKVLYWAIRRKSDPVFKLAADCPIPHMISSVISELKNAERPREGLMSIEIHSIFAYILDFLDDPCLTTRMQAARPKKEKSPMQKAEEYIQEHLTEKLLVGDIAGKLNMDRSHFSRNFKEFSGYSPYEYILISRMDKAKVLLKKTDMSIQRIALESGFPTPSQFTNLFKQRVGMTPNEFRENHF